MSRSILAAVALLTIAFLTGCAQSRPAIVPVEGVLLLNNQPVPHAQVQFIPMERGLGPEYIATGTTDEQGRFTLVCLGQNGACACENRVTVADAAPPDRMRGSSSAAQSEMNRHYMERKNRPIPADYANAARTPLVVAVTASRGEYRLELKP
jgi:hypothetical protein